MKFLIDIELRPDDGGEPFTADQVKEHLQTYVFSTDVSFEMSLDPNDPDHENPGARYRTYMIESATVEEVQS